MPKIANVVRFSKQDVVDAAFRVAKKNVKVNPRVEFKLSTGGGTEVVEASVNYPVNSADLKNELIDTAKSLTSVTTAVSTLLWSYDDSGVCGAVVEFNL